MRTPDAHSNRLFLALIPFLAAVATPRDARSGTDDELTFARPLSDQLSLAGSVQVEIRLPADAIPGTLDLELDGNPVNAGLAIDGGVASGEIADVAPGVHLLRAEIEVNRNGTTMLDAEVSFETVVLENPDECEVLNNAECLLPYPSSHFLEPADTPTGFRLRFPAAGMPTQNGARLSPQPYSVLDGFSPTVQILMHFPGGVDVALSNASRLLEETRTHDLSSLDANSPTVLIDAASGEHVLHFVEADARTDDQARRVLFLRPSESLLPGHRYIVAVRRLLHADGSPVEAEPAFAALRDDRPTDIEGIESRRAAFADIFTRLATAGVERDDLILAFDFVVQSDEGLTGQMLSMRDQALAWLDGIAPGEQTFTVSRVVENDCSLPGAFLWRQVEGTYQAPLFLTLDPVADVQSLGLLNVDENGNPVQNGFTNPDYTIAVPCSVLTPLVGDCDGDLRVTVGEMVIGVQIALGARLLESCDAFDANDDARVGIDEMVRGVDANVNGGGAPKPASVLGHGLFMTGRGFVPLVSAALGPLSSLQGLDPIEIIGGGTDWRGLSGQDLPFAARTIVDLNNIGALPARLRQGQLHALVLGRMMKNGHFNRDPAFQTPSGLGVFAGRQAELYYYGISLGGIMGLMHAALSPDVVAAGIDEGSINFSLLLQRSTQADLFEGALMGTGITDPMQVALALGIMHELWVRGESAAYATHITSNPLPGTPLKRILMTVAFLDQQVTNIGSEITARTLGLSNLVPGSLVTGAPQIPDEPGPLSSAYVVYDAGTFELSNPGPFIPSLANLVPEPNACDPHGDRRPTIPASLQQIGRFFRPDGVVENFCDGACDAGTAFEFPFGNAQRCDPFQ